MKLHTVGFCGVDDTVDLHPGGICCKLWHLMRCFQLKVQWHRAVLSTIHGILLLHTMYDVYHTMYSMSSYVCMYIVGTSTMYVPHRSTTITTLLVSKGQTRTIRAWGDSFQTWLSQPRLRQELMKLNKEFPGWKLEWSKMKKSVSTTSHQN